MFKVKSGLKVGQVDVIDEAGNILTLSANSTLLNGQPASFYRDASNMNAGTLPPGRLPGLSGDISSAAGSSVTTLASVNSNTGSFGSATHSPILTLDAKGRVTAASLALITPAWSSITDRPTTIAGYGLTDALSVTGTAADAAQLGGELPAFFRNASNLNAGTIAGARLPGLSGDISSATGSTVTTLATVNSNTGSFGSSAAVPVLTLDGKGRVTAASTAPLGTAATKNVGTSGNNVPLLDGTNTWSAGNTFGDVVVNGDLSVNGTTFTVNTGNLDVADAIITLAKNNATGAIPHIGIKAERGSAGNDAYLVWSEATDEFVAQTASADDQSGAAQVPVRASRFVSTAATGTAPISVASTTAVQNLNADLLDGQEGSFYQNASNLNAGTLPAARLPALSGDISSTAGSSTTTLATVNSNTGSFGSSSAVPVLTLDGKGRVTAASTAALGTAATRNTGTSGNNVPLLDGANTWSAAQVFSGGIGMGAAPAAGTQIRVSSPVTGAIAAFPVTVAPTIQSDVTFNADMIRVSPATQAASFNIGRVANFRGDGCGLGSGSTATEINGFWASSSISGASSLNIGFRGDVPANTNCYNLYMNGTAPNYLNGQLGIGATAGTNVNLRIARPVTGGALAYSVFASPSISSDVTSAGVTYGSTVSVPAGTTTSTIGFYAQQGVSAGTININYGFLSETNLIGATNNYAFFAGNTAAVAAGRTAYGYYSGINIATGGGTTWNLYAAGTAPNYMAGALGIGVTDITGYKLRAAGALGGATTVFSFSSTPQIQTGVTFAHHFLCSGSLAAGLALSQIHGFRAEGTGLGAGSSVQHQYGFSVSSGLSQGETGNYAYASDLAANGTKNWNLYFAGTAPSYINGDLRIGTTASGGGSKVLALGNGTAPSSNISGGQLFVEDGALKFRGSAGTVTTIAPA